MHEWERALHEFIAPFRAEKQVVGALVAGSYVTGTPSPRSDLDVAIVLATGTAYRERGNRIVGGYLMEYFANSPAQFRAYFERDHAANRRNTATVFATGRVLFDRRGALRALRAQARRWLARPMRMPPRSRIASDKYFLWDSLDNLHDLAERNDPGVVHAYHHHVQLVYETYARCLRQPILPARQLHAYLTDARTRRKYLLAPFPDRTFTRHLVTALRCHEPRRLLDCAAALTDHVTKRLGGFEIDGFRLRTRPSV